MNVISFDTQSGAHVTKVTHGGRTFRKYTHAKRNTPKRVAYDVQQVVNVAFSPQNRIKSIKVS